MASSTGIQLYIVIVTSLFCIIIDNFYCTYCEKDYYCKSKYLRHLSNAKHKQLVAILCVEDKEVTPNELIPRTCGRQTQRSNIEADSPEVYYRRTLTIPLLDHLGHSLVLYTLVYTHKH